MNHVALERRTERVVGAAVVANVVTVAWGLADLGHEEAVEMVEHALLGLFAAELGLRLWITKRRPTLGWWIDAGVILATVLLAFLPYVGSVAKLARMAKLLHVGHVAKHLAQLAPTVFRTARAQR